MRYMKLQQGQKRRFKQVRAINRKKDAKEAKRLKWLKECFEKK